MATDRSNNGSQAAERAQSSATVLAIGTANPPNCFHQADHPDFYFRVTNSDHKTELKQKFKRICERSSINKRYLHLNEEILKQNPSMCSYKAASLDARQAMVIDQVPKLGKEAAEKAIQEWGQPVSKITHLIFSALYGVDMPGADVRLMKLLGLDPAVKRLMVYTQGCFMGGTLIRLAKDIAENNPGSRVLLVCSDITLLNFHEPTEAHLDILVGQAIFGDGASAAIVGAHPDVCLNEHPLFQVLSCSQWTIPETENYIVSHLKEMGAEYYLSKDAPATIGENIERCLAEAAGPIGISDWNELFYVVHPGGKGILDQVEKKLGLGKEKLKASRHVLSEYGNMGAPSVFFVMDEMRRKSLDEGKASTGDGLDCGVLLGIGPGLTVETVVLRSFPIT